MTRRRAFTLGGGAVLYALSLPPFDCWPLAWVALVPLVCAVRRASLRGALSAGAVAGFLTSWTVTWWLVQAISSYFAASIVVGAAATCAAYVLAVSSTFALFAGLATLASPMLGAVSRPIVVAMFWVACEYVRGHVLGDPWALLGYTQYQVLPLIQVATWTGVYGVSCLVALGNAALAEVVSSRASGALRARPLVLPAALVAAVIAAGATVITRMESGGTAGLRVAVMQPNVPPAYSWTRPYAERQLQAAMGLTGRALAVEAPPDLVVWPENSLSLYLEQEPLLRDGLQRVADAHGIDLIVGGPRHAEGRTYNSARLFRPGASRSQVYDKQRLVPFAEAPPFTVAEAAAEESPRQFTAGSRPGVLRGRVTLGVSICHEILYPGTVHGAVREGASVLVNIANDGWLDGEYGVASRQHFAMAVFRAVEARRPLVRASTTGPSGIIDAWGRVVTLTRPGDATSAAATVVPGTELTPYVRHGDWFAVTCLVAAALLGVGAMLPRGRRHPVPVVLPLPS